MYPRIAGIFTLLCVVAVAPLADAARSGTYRCLVAVPLEGVAWIVHHNPNTIAQTVTRIRVWDSVGNFGDTGTISFQVPANGADFVFLFDESTGFVGDMFQVLVNWTQAQDKPAPLPRVDMLPDGSLTSSVRTPCP
jgi:hypothetical protein